MTAGRDCSRASLNFRLVCSSESIVDSIVQRIAGLSGFPPDFFRVASASSTPAAACNSAASFLRFRRSVQLPGFLYLQCSGNQRHLFGTIRFGGLAGGFGCSAGREPVSASASLARFSPRLLFRLGGNSDGLWSAGDLLPPAVVRFLLMRTSRRPDFSGSHSPVRARFRFLNLAFGKNARLLSFTMTFGSKAAILAFCSAVRVLPAAPARVTGEGFPAPADFQLLWRQRITVFQ